MSARALAIGGVATVVLALLVYAAFEAGVERGRTNASNGLAMPSSIVLKSGGVDPSTGKRVLYWHDPMMPGAQFDKPGKSPFMDMQLVPVYADDAADARGVTIDPRVQQNLGIRTTKAITG